MDKISIQRYGIDASGAVNKNKILEISSYDITPLEDETTALSVSIPNDGKPCAIVYHTIIVEPITGLKVTNKANLLIDGDERETFSKTASLSSADWGYLDYTAALINNFIFLISGHNLYTKKYLLLSDKGYII